MQRRTNVTDGSVGSNVFKRVTSTAILMLSAHATCRYFMKMFLRSTACQKHAA